MLKRRASAGRRGLAGQCLALSLLLVSLALVLPAGASAVHIKRTGGRAAPSGRPTHDVAVPAYGELDCNGDSTIQHAIRRSMNCTDIRGFKGVENSNTWGGRFYDNGEYIGHDEPDMTFISSTPGSGNDVTWTETLGTDPAQAPTVSNPGSDIAHWFELTPAPWFSMAMCDPQSYPQNPCTPENDDNAAGHKYAGGAGGAFMEMQFYPPGFAPFDDALSCNNHYWCAALTIDSLECTLNFQSCNSGCEEPVNFGWIQRNGVPTGPPAPGQSNLATFTPNAKTLMMSPGDTVRIHMWDAPIPGGGGARAFEVRVLDVTTGQSGYMQASAANGFADTSISDCSTHPFNFQPEYNTARQGNYIPWAALETDISTEFETGHWEPCTSLSGHASITLSPGVSDTYWNVCHGPYEADGDSGSTEPSDAFCYPQGDTHGQLHSSPDQVTGCLDDVFQNGDLDFDGTPYWPEWPVSATPTNGLPGSFVQWLPTTSGSQYTRFFMQTDIALSESSCSASSTKGCTVPPPGPGHFYPYWSRVTMPSGDCRIEFGNVGSGYGVDSFGQDAQYGTDQSKTLGYPEFVGPMMSNATCDGM
jgi:hypothetical protein